MWVYLLERHPNSSEHVLEEKQNRVDSIKGCPSVNSHFERALKDPLNVLGLIRGR